MVPRWLNNSLQRTADGGLAESSSGNRSSVNVKGPSSFSSIPPSIFAISFQYRSAKCLVIRLKRSAALSILFMMDKCLDRHACFHFFLAVLIYIGEGKWQKKENGIGNKTLGWMELNCDCPHEHRDVSAITE